MSYFPVDDQAAFHPKFVAAGNAAIGLWTRAGSWCKANVSGGHVPREVAALLGTQREARKLVDVGLWEVADGGYQFHDWDHQAGNFAPDQEKSRREKDRDRQRAKRERDRLAREEAEAARDTRRDSSRDVTRDTDRTSERSHAGVTVPPSPSPYPSPVLSPVGEKTPPRKRGTRLDPSWQPSSELIAQMRAECPTVDLRAEHLVFVDYWIGVSGQRGVKADWDGTWRNWMRRKRDDTASRDKPRTTAAQRNLTVVERFAALEDQQHPSALEGM